jgi:hypothetical protein
MTEPVRGAQFVHHLVNGPEGMVRMLFANRQLKGAPAATIFPGVPQVAILPTEFAGETEAEDYLKPLLEPGGNAAAVKISPDVWFVAAWVGGPT